MKHVAERFVRAADPMSPVIQSDISLLLFAAYLLEHGLNKNSSDAPAAMCREFQFMRCLGRTGRRDAQAFPTLLMIGHASADVVVGNHDIAASGLWTGRDCNPAGAHHA